MLEGTVVLIPDLDIYPNNATGTTQAKNFVSTLINGSQKTISGGLTVWDTEWVCG